MADTLQIGTFTQGGRFVPDLDLNAPDGSIRLIRDTLQLTAPPTQTIRARSQRRYGGAQRVGELHDNGTVAMELYLHGNSEDEALAYLDAIIALLTDAGAQRYIKWQPAGASRPSYFEVEGLEWEPMYRAVEFHATTTLRARISASVQPLALGDPMDVWDDFSEDFLEDYTFITGSGTLIVDSGQLAPLATGTKTLIHTARGYEYDNVTVHVKYVHGTTGANVGLILKYLGPNDYLYAQVSGTTLALKKRSNGVEITLASTTVPALTTGESYRLFFGFEDNVLYAQWWEAPPSAVVHQLTGGDATKFGNGVSGLAGLRLAPGDLNVRYDDFKIEPYTFLNKVPPYTSRLTKVPGTAPARMDLHVTMSGLWTPKSALFAWAPAADGAPFGVRQFEDYDEILNDGGTLSVLHDDGAQGENYLSWSTAEPFDRTTLYYEFEPAPAPDAFQDTLAIEVYARINTQGRAMNIRAQAIPEVGAAVSLITYPLETSTVEPIKRLSTSSLDYHWYRLGTLILPAREKYVIAIVLESEGPTGARRLDSLMFVPAQARALSPIGKDPLDNYPVFGGASGRIVRWDLSGGAIFSAPDNTDRRVFGTVPGLGGQMLEPPPGDVDLLTFADTGVIEWPAINGESDLDIGTLVQTHAAITPRYLFTSLP